MGTLTQYFLFKPSHTICKLIPRLQRIWGAITGHTLKLRDLLLRIILFLLPIIRTADGQKYISKANLLNDQAQHNSPKPSNIGGGRVSDTACASLAQGLLLNFVHHSPLKKLTKLPPLSPWQPASSNSLITEWPFTTGLINHYASFMSTV